MPVLIQQGNTKIIAQPGVAVGISKEEDEKTQEAQIKQAIEKHDLTTLELLEGIERLLLEEAKK